MEENVTIVELARVSGKAKSTIYHQAKKLGRTPTLEEVLFTKKGRPKKYK